MSRITNNVDTKEYNKKYNREHKKEIKEYNKQYRKTHNEYYQNHRKVYYQQHKQYFKTHNKKYCQLHKEHVRERDKQYKQQHKAIVRKCARKYREAHCAELAAYHRKYFHTHKNTQQQHKEARRRYRVQKQNCEGTHTEQEWAELKKLYNFKCAVCGKAKKLTEDHIIPLSRGGSDYIENIQPLCKSCNSSKGRRIAQKEMKHG